MADQPRETGTGAEGKDVPEAVIRICLFDGQLQKKCYGTVLESLFLKNVSLLSEN